MPKLGICVLFSFFCLFVSSLLCCCPHLPWMAGNYTFFERFMFLSCQPAYSEKTSLWPILPRACTDFFRCSRIVSTWCKAERLPKKSFRHGRWNFIRCRCAPACKFWPVEASPRSGLRNCRTANLLPARNRGCHLICKACWLSGGLIWKGHDSGGQKVIAWSSRKIKVW